MSRRPASGVPGAAGDWAGAGPVSSGDRAAPGGRPAGPALTRRRALGVAALALAGAAARAAPASAATEGTILLGLCRREQAAAFAYGAVGAGPREFATLGALEGDHVAALATQLAAVGLGPPRPPQDLAGLDPAAARLARAGRRAEALTAAIALEEGLVDLYQQTLPTLPDAKVAMTAATILASHAQHRLILRTLAGGDPLAAA